MKYRKIILAPGGTRNSMESLELFLGHKPNILQSLKARGIGGKKDTAPEVPDKGVTVEVNLKGAGKGKIEQKSEI